MTGGAEALETYQLGMKWNEMAAEERLEKAP